ncbi:hypothetical protein CEUSTIGMA_g12277.t1 [Chlamydomonas eustigma]|uniref:Peptidase M48 domain-containing protein n=1 Tax=Chlamydomonas eustigma TaxID=1157962 RepID=A0A250XP86_9CHLO|nr:hypothetical protein CEUSTIGMA_g12277.t1 [Chlamydomonas eustigma]|eukprot:GAX84856.1 hypothetical protein CEUSTIGMA_g12277.t1 [Chlamydomonas eustigma]
MAFMNFLQKRWSISLTQKQVHICDSFTFFTFLKRRFPRSIEPLTPSHNRDFWSSTRDYQHFKNRGAGGWLNGRMPWILGGSVAVFGGYYIACLETIPYTGRRHSIMFVSRQQEQAMGKVVFEMQREEARQNHTLLPENHHYCKLVKSVGMRVAQVASSEDPGFAANLQHMKGLHWDFAVIQSPVPNAFVVPGGKVVVYTGLLNLLGTEDELAAVLAHETAHVLARHHAERMSTMNLISLARLLFYALLGLSVPQSALFLGVFLPYSSLLTVIESCQTTLRMEVASTSCRLAEHEADAIGLRLMARACHNPEACLSMLNKLGEKEHQMEGGGPKLPAFFRTHPLTSDRVQRVKKEMKEVLRMYDINCSSRRDSLLLSVPRAWHQTHA